MLRIIPFQLSLLAAIACSACNNAHKPTQSESAQTVARAPAPTLIERSERSSLATSSPGVKETGPQPKAVPGGEPSPRAARAIKALDKLGVFVQTDDWSVSLSRTRDLDGAVKLLLDLDHVYELGFGDKATDAHLEVLAKLKDLRRLDLSFNDLVTDKGLVHLMGLKTLRELDVSGCRGLTGAGIANVAGLSELESLRVVNIQLGEQGAMCLGGLRKLKVLDAPNCGIPKSAFGGLAGLTELRELNLSSNEELGDAGARHFAGLTALEKLEISSTGIGADGAKHLAGLGKLTKLDIGSNEVGDAGLKHLAGLTAIASLDLSHTGMTDDGLQYLSGMKALEVLKLQGTGVTGKGLSHLAACKELSTFEVYGMPKFTGEGLHHLAGCPKLTSLNLSWTGVTDAGLADIKKLTQLTLLDLPPYGEPSALSEAFWRDPHPERFSDKGLKHIGEMANLEWLYVSGSGVTDEGLAHLAGLKKLKTLGFGALPNVKGPGLEHLKGLPLLEGLALTQTGVTDESLKHARALKQIKTLSLPKGAKAASIDHLKGLDNLETLVVPKGWQDGDLARTQKALPKANVVVAE